jgi:hypothetical protein
MRSPTRCSRRIPSDSIEWRRQPVYLLPVPILGNKLTTITGKVCGSSFINQAFIQEARKRLEHIELGWEPSYSKEAVLQEYLFRTFEHELKRIYDPAEWEECESRGLRVFGLREDSTRNFGNGMFFITK